MAKIKIKKLLKGLMFWKAKKHRTRTEFIAKKVLRTMYMICKDAGDATSTGKEIAEGILEELKKNEKDESWLLGVPGAPVTTSSDPYSLTADPTVIDPKQLSGN